MLETNLCISVIRDKPTGKLERCVVERGALAISSIVLHELHVGVMRSDASVRHRE